MIFPAVLLTSQFIIRSENSPSVIPPSSLKATDNQIEPSPVFSGADSDCWETCSESDNELDPDPDTDSWGMCYFSESEEESVFYASRQYERLLILDNPPRAFIPDPFILKRNSNQTQTSTLTQDSKGSY